MAYHDGLVDAPDTARLQLRHQLGMRLDGLGHHHQPGGVLVEAMDDTGARHIDDIRHMVQQGIEQRTVGMPGSRMHHQPGRLVDDQQVLVFVDDIQCNVLGQPFALGFLLGLQRQQRTGMYRVARTQHGAIHGQTPLLDPGAQARTRVLREQLRGDLVKALAAQFVRHFGLQMNSLDRRVGHGLLRRGAAFGFGGTLVVKYGVFAPTEAGRSS